MSDARGGFPVGGASIDWQASKEAWIAQVDAELISLLRADGRFQNVDDIVEPFQRYVAAWRAGGSIRQAIEYGNELAAAEAILRCSGKDDRLQYEPRLLRTPKSIDFLVTEAEGAKHWIDVKTISPRWIDDEPRWQKFLGIANDFPENARLVVDRDLGGAALGNQAINTRWSFIQRTKELEDKSVLLDASERGTVRLLLCANNNVWNDDELEDFADYYFTGQYRPDDWSRNATARYLVDEGIAYRRDLTGFCFLARAHDEVSASEFRMDVRGPSFP